MIENDIIDEDFVEGLDYDTIIRKFLLNLRKKINIFTKAIYFVSKKTFFLLSIYIKQHAKMFYRVYSNSSNIGLHYQPKAILISKSPLQLACKLFSSKKALSNFIKQEENFGET